MSILWIALLALGSMALIFGLILGYSAIRFRVESDPIVDQINHLLPQTQCGQCGYPGCKPYAEAIANGDDINKCPPGGDTTIKNLADLLGREVKSLNEAHDGPSIKKVAFIREEECIGCTKCIQACPVDAIVGAARQMHTVIASVCTGCDLCVEPCPVDCIDMIYPEESLQTWHWQLPDPVSRRVDIIATDTLPVDEQRNRAA